MLFKVEILRGIPGSGKSTFAKKLIEARSKELSRPLVAWVDYVIVSADQFFERDGEYKFDAKELDSAHKMCLQNFEAALRGNIPYIIVDNTNLSAWEISPYYLLADAKNYSVRIITVRAPPEVAHKRGIHGVTWSKTTRMFERLIKGEQEMPWHWKKENYP